MPPNDIAIAPQNVGSFYYLGRSFYIWESTRNIAAPSPRLWQFRYAPLLLPEFTQSGSLNVRKVKTRIGRRCLLSIRLYDSESDRLAYEAVQRLYPARATDIQSGNVTVLPVGTVRFAIDDLAQQVPSATVVEDASLFLLENMVTLVVDVPNDEAADAFLEYLPTATLRYAVSFDAKSTRQNAVSVRFTDLRASKLFVELDGRETRDAYVHRDDLRKLTEGISRTIETRGVIEDPTQFDSDLYQKILTTLTQNVSSANFDAEKWRATYNADDLRPDVISKTLNKLVSKDETENRWKYHAEADTALKAEALKLFSADGKFKGSYDDEGLKRALAERNIEAEFEGTRIVAKSIGLRQVNLAQFAADGEFVSVTTFVEDSAAERLGSINFAAVVAADGAPDLFSRVAALEASRRAFEEPIRTIRLFAGAMMEAEAQQVLGWWVCDGRVVNDPSAPEYHGQPTPNLVDRFVLAAAVAGRLGGASQFSIADQTVTVDTVGWNAGVTAHMDFRLLIVGGGGWGDGSPIRSQGTVRGATVPLVPPYYSAIYLIKVR